MNRLFLAAAAAAVLIVAIFATGVVAGSMGFIGLRAPAAIGSGYVGDHVVSFRIGDVTYGARGSVAWRDVAGSEHEGGWPDCLPAGADVGGIPFIGAIVWHDSVGDARILWVDCRGG